VKSDYSIAIDLPQKSSKDLTVVDRA